jgi:very-short-patch-repair endonuclease
MQDHSLDGQIAALAQRQHGLVARRQLPMMGANAEKVHHRIKRGSLRPIGVHVLAVAGTPDTDRQRIMAAVLDASPPAVVGFDTAAFLWGLPGFPLGRPEVIARRHGSNGRRDHLAKIHNPRDLLDEHVTEVDGLPVTTPSRLIIDLASDPRSSPQRTERALEAILARRLATVASVGQSFDRLMGRGKSGTVLMRALLTDRRENYRPMESGLEFRFRSLVKEAGVGSFQQQVDISTQAGWVGRMDFVHSVRALVVEIDGSAFHGALTDQRRDTERRETLESNGWTVVVFSDVDLFHRPADVVRRVRAAAHQAVRKPTAA